MSTWLPTYYTSTQQPDWAVSIFPARLDFIKKGNYRKHVDYSMRIRKIYKNKSKQRGNRTREHKSPFCHFQNPSVQQDFEKYSYPRDRVTVEKKYGEWAFKPSYPEGRITVFRFRILTIRWHIALCGNHHSHVLCKVHEQNKRRSCSETQSKSSKDSSHVLFLNTVRGKVFYKLSTC